MADNAQDKPQRSAADKERSRQLSRPVSGREAARTSRGGRPQGKPQQGGRRQGQQGAKGRQGQQSGRPPSKARPGQRPQRPAPRRGRPAPRGRAPRTGLFIWGSVAVVVIVVVVLVVVNLTSSTKSVIYTPKPVTAAVEHDVTHVPSSVYNAVGTGISGTINVPSVVSSQKLLTFTAKPGVFGLFGEFCPYCAAERWAVIAALSRFGTFHGLMTMQSATTDVDPGTQTFEFATTTYSSPYISAKLLEFYGQDEPTGKRPIVRHPTKAEAKIVEKYDHPSTTYSAGTIPFLDVGNKVFAEGVSYSPNILQGLSRATIARSLRNPNSPVTKEIIGASNYISAAICAIDGGKPGSVCSSAGVQTAAKALKLSF
jgi:hypothetical protein